jgi:hypothetical protein
VATLPTTAQTIPVGWQYGDLLELAAIQPEPLEFPLDEDTAVSLFWRVISPQTIQQNLFITAQLLTIRPDGWEPLVQHHSYPALGGTLTSGWRTGEIWQDKLIFAPSSADLPLNGPTLVTLAIWAGDEQGQLPITLAGQTIDPPFVQAGVLRPRLAPPDEAIRLPAPIRFGDSIELVALSRQGEELVLWWQAVASTPHDYKLFVQLFSDATGEIVAQADGVPNAGLSPTAVWLPGELIRDVRQIAPDGTVAIGWYDGQTGERLTAVDTATGEHLLNDSFLIIASD